jgi:hypothetical protein
VKALGFLPIALVLVLVIVLDLPLFSLEWKSTMQSARSSLVRVNLKTADNENDDEDEHD